MKTYYLLLIASWISRFVPPRMAYWLCSLVGGVLFYVKPSTRRAVMDNMRHVLPGSSVHRRRTIARRVIRNVVKNYYDLVRLQHLESADLERIISIEGAENLDKAYAGGKGVIIIGGHFGNFNLVPQIAVIRGYPVTAVAEDIKPTKLYNYLNRLRTKHGLKFINAGSPQIRTIYKLLRNNNGGLILAADRDVTEAKEPVQFFDAPADLPPGPVALALRLGAALVPAHSMRLPDNTSRVQVYPPIELERTGDNDRDVKVNLRKVAQVLEEMILKAPDQWVVLQRVWDREVAPESVSTMSMTNGASEPNGSQPIPFPLEAAKSEERSPSSVSK
jgi:lauroyl/myristoyl acyltransferase